MTRAAQAKAYLQSRPIAGGTAWSDRCDEAIAKSIREGLIRWNPADDTIQLTAKGELHALQVQ